MTTYLQLVVPAARTRQLLFPSVKSKDDLVGIHRRESIEQVGDIEADLDLIARVRDLDLVLGFFLFGVMCLDRDEI